MNRYEVRPWVCDWGIFDKELNEFIGKPLDSYVQADFVLRWYISTLIP